MIAQYQSRLNILHLHSAPGLSKARNVGLRAVSGDVIAFPDDDCWYPDGLLAKIEAWFAAHPEYDGCTGKVEDGQGSACVGRWEINRCEIDKLNVWRTGVSITIFLRRNLVNDVGLFDEELGAGADSSWGSGEETDYLIRCIRSGYKVIYDPEIVVFHPNPIQQYSSAMISRGFKYGAGMGRVLRKHGYPIWFKAYSCYRPLGGALLSIISGRISKAKYHWMGFRGRVYGCLQ